MAISADPTMLATRSGRPVEAIAVARTADVATPIDLERLSQIYHAAGFVLGAFFARKLKIIVLTILTYAALC